MKTDRQPGGLGTGLGLGTEQGPGHEQRQQPEPGDEAKARFERLLAGELDDPRQRPPLPGPGQGPLPGPAGLFGPAGPAAPAPGAGVQCLVDEVAERVLVSDSRFDASQEVRIKIKDTVFPGLEVRLRQMDGRLQVELVAAQAGDLLVLRREAGRLVDGLRGRLGRAVELRLTVEPPDGGPVTSELVEHGDTAPSPGTLPRGPAG